MGRANQRGFSIIEVLLMSGAMVAALVGFMSLMDHESKSMNYLEDRLSRVSLESEIRMEFAAGDLCKNLLTGVKAPTNGGHADIGGELALAPRKSAMDKIFRSQDGTLTYDRLTITKITLEDSDLTNPDSNGSANLVLYPERIRTGGGPSVLRPIKIKTALAVDADYKIKSCDGDQGEGCATADIPKVIDFPQSMTKRSCTSSGNGGGGGGGGHWGGAGGGEQCSSTKFTLSEPYQIYVNGKFIALPLAPAQIPSQQLVVVQALYQRKGKVGDSKSLQMQCSQGKWYSTTPPL